MLLLAVGLPFLAAALVPLVYRVVGEKVAYVGAAVAATSLGLVLSQFQTSGEVGVEWIPSLGVTLSFYVDGLSLLIAVLASGIGVLIFTYCGGYMHGEPAQPRFYASLLAFMGSMLGLVLAADLVALFVFWELTSVTSFSLIGHYSDERDSVYAARKSMLITVAGGLFLLAGIVMLYAVSGDALTEPTFSIVTMLENGEAMRATLRERGLFVPVLATVGLGAAAKSAQVPLHVWLPDAMEAPTPVSAFLHSATMVKAGIYLFGRFRPLLSSAEWQAALLTLGLATMTVGAVLAVAADDIKALLAYSTASHLGLITAGFAFGTSPEKGGKAFKLGAETGAFHIFNHAVFKAALFLVAGIVAHEAGSRLLSELGGLRGDLPVTAAVAGVAGLSMAGIPPLNGFHSKELLFEAAFEFASKGGGLRWVVPAVAVGASMFTVLYSYRFVSLFIGEKPAGIGAEDHGRHDDPTDDVHESEHDDDVYESEHGDAHESEPGHHAGEVHRPPPPMLAGPVVLGTVAVVVGLMPTVATDFVVGRAFDATAFAPGAVGEGFSVSFPTKLKGPVVMSGITVAGGLLLIPVEPRVRDGIRSVLARDRTNADFYYDGSVEGLTRLSAVVVPRVQTGLLRTYATWVLGAFAGLALLGHLVAGPDLPLALGDGVTVAVGLVLLLAVGSAVVLTRRPANLSHVSGVLTLSVFGFMLAIFFILVAAPDLALTQLVVETLLLVLFLLVLHKLPAYYGEWDIRESVRDAALSLLVGAAVFVTVLASTASTPDSRYFLRTRMLELAGFGGEESAGFTTAFGGGGNVVNVILVDFRAFDTLGEIAVIAVAAVSVVTMLRMREVGAGSVTPDPETDSDPGPPTGGAPATDGGTEEPASPGSASDDAGQSADTTGGDDQ